MKIVIIDDDVNILKGLYCLIDYHALGRTDIYASSDALEALDLCRRERPQVVLTDIRMPGMSGLELVETLRRELPPDTYYVIISGYEDFTYAKRAIHLGVIEYLLKPVSETELMRILGDIRSSIEEKQRTKLKVKTDLWNKKYFYMSRLIHRIGIQQPENLPRELFGEEEPFRLCLLRMSGSDWRDDLLQYQQPILQYYDESQVFQFLHRNYLVHVMLGVPRRELAAPTAVRAMWPQGRLCITQPMHGLTQLPDLFARSILWMEYNRLFGGGWPLMLGGEQLESTDITVAIAIQESRFIAQLQTAVLNRDYPAMESLFKEMDGILCRRGTVVQPENVRCLLSNLIKSIAEFISGQESAPPEIPRQLWQLAEITENATYQTICSQFLHILFSLCFPSDDDAGVGIMIERVKRHIQDNYPTSTLSLSSIAEQFHVNACYLSSIFHKKTGTRFWSYVLKIRLNKADRLLRTTNQSVQTVCYGVGFNNLKTFYKAFKQQYGMTPNKWRNRHDRAAHDKGGRDE